jgi:hypothetical protein
LEGPEGRYENGAYRIDLEPSTSETLRGTMSIPRKASKVYPLAPRDLRIEVEARSLDPLDDHSGYGVICHLNEGTKDRYQFTIGEGDGNTVRITKFLRGHAPELLKQKYVAALNATTTNKIRAECTNMKDAEDGGVYLAFRINGETVAHHHDRQPLPDGTIGIRAFTRQGGIRAEFNNIVVTRV